MYQQAAVSGALELLSAGPCDRVGMDALTIPLVADPFTAAEYGRALLHYTLQDPESLVISDAGGGFNSGHRLSSRKKLWGIIRYKPNRTRRMLRDASRQFPPGMPEPAPDLASTLGARLRREWVSPLDSALYSALLRFHPNTEGVRDVMRAWAWGVGYLDGCAARGSLFLARAMRAARAAMLWRLDHGGTPPAALVDLVPRYLAEIPADPWNGAPLGWDAASETITAVGSDWLPTPPDPARKAGTAQTWSGVAELRVPAFFPSP